ncbi:hypothetical protein KVG29_08710 [Caldicoprobacter algeriensis]|uniref:hypothetical protein n=1 Tax=Caldicoprobacter algeriensis TaxID=699281 RepID=UPI0020799BBC|nr:hypothetical protein [Caldicoprobacter algeriensis]MCM8901299.1 hypothetical protein [Caldicoprobacter algeriensis]
MRIFRCDYCGFIAPEPMFKWGKGKEFGQHPEHRYCPRCYNSIDWYGYGVLKVVNDTWEDFLSKVRTRRMKAYAGK